MLQCKLQMLASLAKDLSIISNSALELNKVIF